MLIETKDCTPLAVDVWGAGRPVVLVHAWGLDAHMWNAQLPAFVGAGLQVVTIDQRGHGRSGRSSAASSRRQLPCWAARYGRDERDSGTRVRGSLHHRRFGRGRSH